MREMQILARIRSLAERGRQNKAILKGIGDDCAILRPAAQRDLVFTSDFVLEGPPFPTGYASCRRYRPQGPRTQSVRSCSHGQSPLVLFSLSCRIAQANVLLDYAIL